MQPQTNFSSNLDTWPICVTTTKKSITHANRINIHRYFSMGNNQQFSFPIAYAMLKI